MHIINYFTDFYPIILLSTPIYLLFRFLWIKLRKKPLNWGREALVWIFSMYIIVFLFYTLMPNRAIFFQDYKAINFIPFKSIKQYYWGGGLPLGVRILNLIGNFLIFAPAGFFPPILWKKARSFWKIFLIGSLFIISIEFIQYFIGRVADIDDYILNMIGFVIGYIFFLIFSVLFNRDRKSVV